MGDAEWMYENDLDPFYRKDKVTGELVEWEGGLNPAYEDDDEPYLPYERGGSEDPLEDINMFNSFEEAMEWAKKNPGKSIVKSPDGNGYVAKDLDDENVEFEYLTDDDFKEIAQAMEQLANNLQESSTAALLCREFDLAEQLRTAASIAKKMAQLTYENVEEMGQEMQQLADSLQDAALLVNPLREPEFYEGLCDSATMAKDLGTLLIHAKPSEADEQKQVQNVERCDTTNLGFDVGDEFVLDTMGKMAPTLFPYLDRPSCQEKFSAAGSLNEKREGQMLGFFNKRKKNEIEKTYGREDVFTSPNDPVPELQSQEGIRSYESKLSGFNGSDFAKELGLVMAAMRNIQSQERVTGSFSKQEILDDLADKAVTICFHDPSIAWMANRFSGDLSSLKSILKQVDAEVSRQKLKSPEEHGHEMLMKLMVQFF